MHSFYYYYFSINSSISCFTNILTYCYRFLILKIGGISYMSHPQATPTTVTDFNNIEKITTSLLKTSTLDQNHSMVNKDTNNVNKATPSPIVKKISDEQMKNCSCNAIKTILKIKVLGNS